jgi:hypothetical protein
MRHACEMVRTSGAVRFLLSITVHIDNTAAVTCEHDFQSHTEYASLAAKRMEVR